MAVASPIATFVFAVKSYVLLIANSFVKDCLARCVELKNALRIELFYWQSKKSLRYLWEADPSWNEIPAGQVSFLVTGLHPL